MPETPIFAITCPQCGDQAEATADLIGDEAQCPNCDHIFVVQAPEESRAQAVVDAMVEDEDESGAEPEPSALRHDVDASVGALRRKIQLVVSRDDSDDADVGMAAHEVGEDLTDDPAQDDVTEDEVPEPGKASTSNAPPAVVPPASTVVIMSPRQASPSTTSSRRWVDPLAMAPDETAALVALLSAVPNDSSDDEVRASKPDTAAPAIRAEERSPTSSNNRTLASESEAAAAAPEVEVSASPSNSFAATGEMVEAFMVALATNDPAGIEAYGDLDPEAAWQYFALGSLFELTVAPLRFAAADCSPNLAGTWSFGKSRVPAQLRDFLLRYTSILTRSQALIGENLPEPPLNLDIDFLREYFEEIGRLTGEMAALHRDILGLAVPGKPPYSELQELMFGWASEYCDGLDSLVRRCKAKSDLDPEDAALSVVQFTLMSPGIHRFVRLYRRMLTTG